MAGPVVKVSDVHVRPFLPGDRATVRSIALSTAMAGSSSSMFFDGDEFLADALTGYFTDREPESCFVAVLDGEVVGYIIGARDTIAMDACFTRKMLFPLVQKALCAGLLFRARNIRFLYQVMRAAFSGRLWAPDFSREYPATLHINLLPQARGSGLGGRLMASYLGLLRKNGVSGVRMATMSEDAGRFFEHQGFKLLYRSSRPYFHHILGRDVPLLVYGRFLR